MLNLKTLVHWFAWLPWLLVIGCGSEAEIRVYKVPKEAGGPSLSMPGRSEPAEATQILGAIVPNRNAAWFFKLTGDPEVVAENSEEFRKIVDSVSFNSAGEPSWELSEGWSQQLAQGMSYAKLNKVSAGLTATVTQLFNVEGDVPWNESSWQTYVMENVNRWRTQLALAKERWEAMEPGMEEVPELSQGPAKAYFVSLVGEGSGAMRGPFQGAASPADAGPSSAAPANTPPATASAAISDGSQLSAPTSRPQVRGDAPDAWTPLDVSSSSMRLLAFAVDAAETENKTEVTVIEAGGDIAANMNMWMNQIAMQPSPDKINDVVGQAEDLPVNDVVAKVYWLDGSPAESQQAILVADVPWQENSSLFVKLKGDAETVSAQRDNFFGFVRSLRWDAESAAAEPAAAESDSKTGDAAADDDATATEPAVSAEADASPSQD